MSKIFQLYPAVDISHGKSIRLTGKELDLETSTQPQENVQSFKNSGASWIHIVDLDQAYGTGENQALIGEIIKSNSDCNFQISGGVRNEETFATAVSSGAGRINLSSQSLSDRDWLGEKIRAYSDQVSFALDVTDGVVQPRGTNLSLGELDEVLEFLAESGLKTIVVTDTLRDGMLTGPNLDLLSHVFEKTGLAVVASGGIASLSDLEALAQAEGVSGVVLGKALYQGLFTLEDAFSTVANP